MTDRPAHIRGSAARTHCGLSPKDDPVPIIARRNDDATCTPCLRSALSLSEARCAALERNLTTPRPYTDAELARDPAVVTAALEAVDVDAQLTAARDRTLALKALADLADRVNLIDRSTTERFEEVWHRLDTVTKALDRAADAAHHENLEREG